MAKRAHTDADRAKNWMTVTEPAFPWEREALEFVRSQFPAHGPYRAWSNFEFIADDGSINEVDLLAFTPQGFFLFEIKSRPGRLFGDAGAWTWDTDGRLVTEDNPLLLANGKAKKLRFLLQGQKACKKRKGKLPFIEALVFCSAAELQCELSGTARYRVCLRDRPAEGDRSERAGITAAIKRRECAGLDAHPKGTHDQPTAKIVAQAMEQAGLRPSQRSRKVSDYVLDHLIDEGPGYQDWQATHTALQNVRRRIRVYNVRTGATEDERATIERAARREAELLEALQHPGVLRREGFTEHELGPALIFEHDPQAIRLDHFLSRRQNSLGVEARLDLMRQIAEVIRFAHDKRVVHRALSPRSVLVTASERERRHVKLLNWQVGYRKGSTSSGVSAPVSATSHIDRLVEDASTAYMAPEAASGEGDGGEHLDVFSLGALAYHLFSGQPPAANGVELSSKLRETKGLQISSVLNGAGENLQALIQWSTYADVGARVDSVSDFLDLLEEVEDELTAPDHDTVEDPNAAQKGDVLPGNFTVLRRLGQGACSVVLLVQRDDEAFVLKAANDPSHNARLKDEAAVLQKLRHSHIVEHRGSVEIGAREAFLMRPVFANKEERRIETLGQRLRREGRLHVDLLQRFGEDLLGVVNFLEEEGLPHRDLKPDNIAIGQIKRGHKLHLVLFDFSMSRTPADNLRAGTTGYLDPLLPLRKPPRWDLHAERYAAAATLYELATGPNNLPTWGDGASDPSHLDCEATIDGDLFDASLRDSLTAFFQRAFRRDPAERFDNAEQMLDAWRDCFAGIEKPGALSDHEDEDELRQRLAAATFDSQIPELGLGTRATNALDRANVLTVDDLLTVPVRRLHRLRGVGNKTRREVGTAVRLLRERLGSPTRTELPTAHEDTEAAEEQLDIANLSVDLLTQRLTRANSRDSQPAKRTMLALLGLDANLDEPWPSQTEVARCVGFTRGHISQLVGKFQNRWAKEPALNQLRADLAELIQTAGGVMTIAELAEALLVARGSAQDEPQRTKLSTAVARAGVEVERTMATPRFLVRRDHGRVLVALSQDLAGYAARLGDEADRLAESDPLIPPARVLQRLREVSVPADAEPLSDARIVRLAAAASQQAAVSSRQEVYRREMEAARALKLSQGALYGVASLTVSQIHERVRGRYPEAAPLPGRPALDELLRAAGFDFQWDPAGKGGGCYASRLSETPSITSGSGAVSRLSTASSPPRGAAITPEIANARQFEERLERGIKEGSFLALLVSPKYYERAAGELSRRFPVELVDLEGLFLDALREAAEKAKVSWELVVKTDARPNEGDWSKLMLLVRRALPAVEAKLSSADETLLVVYAGLLARYDQIALLERLRDRVGRRDGIPGLWLLVAGDRQAMMDGKAIPLIGPGQQTRVPESWVQNAHRGWDGHDRGA